MSWLLQRAEEQKEWCEKLWEQAYQRIPKKYHEFIVGIAQNIYLGFSSEKVTEELRKLGVFTRPRDDKTMDFYIRLSLPYTSVDGRVAWARDEHLEAGKRLNFMPAKYDFANGICQVTVVSELRGEATGTAKIGGTGMADKTHPYENAETSAIGRALGFLGYGLLGTGIASAEEVQSALREQENGQVPQKQTAPPPKHPAHASGAAWWETGVPIEIQQGILAGQKMVRVRLDTKKVVNLPEHHPGMKIIQAACRQNKLVRIYVCKYQDELVIAGREAEAVKPIAG